VVDVFPVDQQPQVRLTLSEVIIGIVSQQLLRRMDGQGRIAALEIMVGNHAIGHLIREGKSHQVNNVIMTGKKEGMQLMDSHLKELVDRRVVAPEDAARFAEEPEAILAYARSRDGKQPTMTTK
jgi:twitching motility protein PilT